LNNGIGLDLVCASGLNHHHHNQQQQQQQQPVEVEVEEEVLAMAEELPLDTAELANQASRLLEEHDLTNVLNQIPADAFNDLFTGTY
jgi:energy-coupling factor transporter ATP-binding protein EcfA2